MRILPAEWEILDMMQITPALERWMTVEQIAERLGKKPVEVRVWVDSLWHRDLLVPSLTLPREWILNEVLYHGAVLHHMQTAHHTCGSISYLPHPKEREETMKAKAREETGQGSAAQNPEGVGADFLEERNPNRKSQYIRGCIRDLLDVKRDQGLSAAELAVLLGGQRSGMYYHLNALKEEGVVRRVKDGRRARWMLDPEFLTKEDPEPTPAPRPPICTIQAAKIDTFEEGPAQPEGVRETPSRARIVARAISLITEAGFPIDAIQMGEELENPICMAGEIIAQVDFEGKAESPGLLRVILEKGALLRCELVQWEVP